MLLLTRKLGEEIYIGKNDNDLNIDIKIVVVKSGKYNCVKLGIEAPKDMFVHRGEIYNHIKNKKNNIDNK